MQGRTVTLTVVCLRVWNVLSNFTW